MMMSNTGRIGPETLSPVVTPGDARRRGCCAPSALVAALFFGSPLGVLRKADRTGRLKARPARMRQQRAEGLAHCLTALKGGNGAFEFLHAGCERGTKR